MAEHRFQRKKYGRIFVEKESDVEVVKCILEKMDNFEYEYLPSDFVVVFRPETMTFGTNGMDYYYKLDMKPTGNFYDININELQFRCWKEGVHIFVCFGDENSERYDAW